MKQQAFEQTHADLWADYRALLARLEQAGRKRLPVDAGVEQLPRLLRTLSGHYALARARGYSPGLVAELEALVSRGYHQLHRPHPRWPTQLRDFLLGGFPRALRAEARLFWLSAALFFGPMLAMGLACAADAALIYSLLSAEDVAGIEAMYDPQARRFGPAGERHAGDDVAMFGYYVRNNLGVAFRTFASGILFGVGSLFFIVFNGLYIGAVAGHLTGIGHGVPFWSFVSGHSALELTAIVISGAAGLLLARALLAPGRYTRRAALRRNAAAAVPLVVGAMLMLLVAAVMEAFWSSLTNIPPPVKYAVGALGWVLLGGWLTLAGRAAASAAAGPAAAQAVDGP